MNIITDVIRTTTFFPLNFSDAINMYLSKSFSRTCQPMMQTRRKASNTHRHGIPGSFPGSKVGIAIRIYMILDIRGRRPIFRITPNSSF